MDAVKRFFQKYGAVPANNAGPVWSAAADEMLLVWATQDAESWDRHPEDRPYLRGRMQEIRDELWFRLIQYPKVPFPDQPEGYRRLRAGWYHLSIRAGFGPG
jgi:hypothetical protein